MTKIRKPAAIAMDTIVCKNLSGLVKLHSYLAHDRFSPDQWRGDHAHGRAPGPSVAAQAATDDGDSVPASTDIYAPICQDSITTMINVLFIAHPIQVSSANDSKSLHVAVSTIPLDSDESRYSRFRTRAL